MHLYVQELGIKGKGLFTSAAFKKGELVFIAPGTTRVAHFEGNDCYLYPDWYGVDEHTWIDITYPFVKINHSCSPNTGIFSSRCFVALRDIEAGEEVTFDYSTSDDESDWVMGPTACACEAQHCRVHIGPIQTLPQPYIDQVYPYIPNYFIKKYHLKGRVDSSVDI
ncbi:SET domain-containing protein [Patescibacteria group bacterium]|nr:SET domain-containing protein [Patescibacteria group bacterium]